MKREKGQKGRTVGRSGGKDAVRGTTRVGGRTVGG